MSEQKRHTLRSRPYRRVKPRAGQGQLRTLTHHAREALHAWFRENNREVPYKVIQRRLKEQFDVSTSVTSLSDYYRDKESEIFSASEAEADHPKTIIIRIEVPAGVRIAVTTDEEAGS